MKNKVIVTACTLLAMATASAQNAYDAEKLLGNDLNGTARFVGMVTVGAAATGEAVMDGMAQADVIRGYMPEDTPTAMALHAQVGIIM